MPQYDSSSFPLVTTTAPDDRVLFWQDAEGRNARISMEDLLAPLPGSVLPVVNGGTGQSTYTDGQLLIGNSNDSSLTKATLTAGANITISNGPGSIMIAASGSGTGSSVPTTGALYSRLVKSIAGSISTPLDMRWQSPDIYNVKDFGAVGSDTSTVNGNQGYVLATEMIAGNHYVIKNTGSGTTDFVTAGAADNTPGTAFVANGAVTGTGQAYVDDSFAFQAAIDAASAKKNGAVYVPAGLWGVRNLSIAFANNPTIAIIGDGPEQSRLQNFLVGNNTQPILSWFPGGGSLKSPGYISGVAFKNYGNRASGNPILVFEAAERIVMTDVSVFAMYDCMSFTRANLHATNLFVASGTTNNEYSGCCIKMVNCSAKATNCNIVSTSLLGDVTIPGVLPPIWLTGTATGHSWVNCTVTGGGTRFRAQPTSMVITSSSCLIDGIDGHTLQVGDYVVVDGATPSYFNGHFRVTARASTSVTVTNGNVDSSADVTTAYAMTVPCCVLIDNSNGSMNECSWVGGLLEAAGYPTLALSTAFYFDGRAYGGAGDGYTLSGWTITGTYIDFGRVSVLITGGGTDGTALTSNRISISNIMSSGNAGDSTSSMLGQVWVEQTPGVSINGMIGSASLVDGSAIGLYAYADADPAHISCDGLRVTGCHLGAPSVYNYANSPRTVCNYGVVIDGAINGLVLTDNVIAGATAPVLIANSGVSATSIVTSDGNSFHTGTSEPAAATVIPTVASGTTITLPWNDTINISGTTTVQTINGGWVGREVQLLVASGVTFNTGGNIKAANAVAAGASITLLFDGSYWWKV